MTRLVPKPHMLKSIRARNWWLAGALEELVDNSLGHGRAKNVRINIDNAGGISVIDDGIGIDDINRMFRLGDASAYGSSSEIGQYGVGAKNATIYLGDLVTVSSVRNGIKHTKTIDWGSVEKQGEWPEQYTGSGRSSKDIGTVVKIGRLARRYKLKTSEELAKEFGQTFAPALRNGVQISLNHCLADGKDQEIIVTPFTPHDLTKVKQISGSIKTKHGDLKWTGMAGLSATLKDEFNFVHVAFGHRVIERDRGAAFGGRSAPTLYADVQLDETLPWKYQLSEHKDKIVSYHDELFANIYEAIKDLVAAAEEQAQDLALNAMAASIEMPLNKAMKKAGVLFIDEDEEPTEGGYEDGEGNRGKGGKHLRTPIAEGTPAAAPPRPTGVKVDYRDLNGRAFGWHISGKLMTIELDKKRFAKVLKWPPGIRDEHTIRLIVSFLSHALEMEFYENEHSLKHTVTPKLYKQIEEWAATNEKKIAPYVYAALMDSQPAE